MFQIEKEEQQAAAAKAEAKDDDQVYRSEWGYQQEQSATADAGEWGASGTTSAEVSFYITSDLNIWYHPVF